MEGRLNGRMLQQEAHRVSRHLSTKYTPFFLMYNRQHVLPIDIQYNLITNDDADEVEYSFNKETFDTMLSVKLSLRQKAHQKADKSIMKAQNNGIPTGAISYQRPLKSKMRPG